MKFGRTDTSELKKAGLWFKLTSEERWIVGGLLAIFLVGLCARWWHLAHERRDVYVPEKQAEKPR